MIAQDAGPKDSNSVTPYNGDTYYMHYMKVLGIIYLLIWHTGFGIMKINVFAISFFLQMFVFISGYFYNDKYSDNPLLFIKKRIISLYIPLITYCSIFLCLNNVFVNLHIYKETQFIPWERFGAYLYQIMRLQPNLQMAGAMWYVCAIFLAAILFCLVSSILKKIAQFNKSIKKVPKNSIENTLNNPTDNTLNNPIDNTLNNPIDNTLNNPTVNTFNKSSQPIESIRFFIVISLFLYGNYLGFIKVTLQSFFDISLVFVLFFYSGYIYRKYENRIPINIYMALSSLFTLMLCTKYGYPVIVNRSYINPPFLLICGLAGTYLNIYIAKKAPVIRNIKLSRFIEYAGKNTMAILALHFLAFKPVSLLLIYFYHLPLHELASFPVIKYASLYHRIVYIAAGIILPLSAKYLFDIVRFKIKLFFATKSARSWQ
ncbi:conserved membrane hypothetical protein [Desulfamplus magnetovallimortis]|uniref:Acyltransferase 3 domain-containing protein n=1 Tax=Desulfamplus magnetovallimortis TaxID=1246637 RepID=A0A1W1H588_9BACT|nr:acyltransferase family protein [Desulfamplus magnetovallimortis]SLM27614.1 conserved membrane hypothetical protein [Desulfamplus magnetovallimortis]